MTIDRYDGLRNPAHAGLPRAIVPSDATPLVESPKFFYVGTGGNVSVIAMGDSTLTPVLLKNVPAGFYLFVRVSHIRSTGTTAADIVGIY